jgi:hypothetical protein
MLRTKDVELVHGPAAERVRARRVAADVAIPRVAILATTLIGYPVWAVWVGRRL